jgi:hypothetical protein
MKEVPANKKKSLGKLPTSVRNKMGYMKKGGKVGGAGYTKDKSRSKFAEGYAQGLDTELESNPIKRVINKGMEKFLNKGTTVYKRKGKDKKGYDKGVADAKKAMKIVDRNYLKGR